MAGVLALFGVGSVAAQTVHQIPESANQPEHFSQVIEDNSFYIEEAFNQEAGIVQHISPLTYFPSPQKDVVYSLTQEWPLGSQTHQLSFTLPYSFLNGTTVVGLGDILINYRYQLTTGDDWAAVSPRLSVILPTGDSGKGLGNEVVGFQCNIPVSKRLSELFIAHVNVGATVVPNVKGMSLNLGGSVVVLATPEVNFLFESGTNFLSELEDGAVVHTTETILSPGMRMAIDVSELQIVPGLAVPFVHTSGKWHVGGFLYLSFEHPF